MRHIQKSEEPKCFTEWKQGWNPGWDDFDGKPIKQDVKRSLLQEQGDLCCYCEARVEENDGHFEHIQTRHAYPELALVYENMLYSCTEMPRGKPNTCGHARKTDAPVPISPLNADCESKFRYKENGRMLPCDENDTDARETVRILNLNATRLCLSRESVYEEIVDAYSDLAETEFQRWIKSELEPDEQGRLKPYWGTKRYIAQTL